MKRQKKIRIPFKFPGGPAKRQNEMAAPKVPEADEFEPMQVIVISLN